MKRRILSIITALALCWSLCPTWAFAVEAEPDTGLCVHHPYHTDECGYIQADPGQPCGYECKLCPIKDMIAALPRWVTEGNAETVRWQLDEILDLYQELSEDEQKQIDMTLCWDLLAALDEANAPAPVAGEVSTAYQEASWNGSAVTYTNRTASCTPVTDSATEWTNGGWYVVNSSVTIEKPITVSGEVNLILADGCTLNAEQGILVTENNTLTIYAQSGGTGTLNATGLYDTSGMSDTASAGIGGGTTGSTANSGTITIHGGMINATGGNSGYNNSGVSAAGIGGGTSSSNNGGNSGTIVIYGGMVTANSSLAKRTGAGIGGGAAGGTTGGNGGNVTIYGGTVTATSSGGEVSGAGIGGGAGQSTGGAGSDIKIYGGTVTATSSGGTTSGAGIGGGAGYTDNGGAGSNITISGGSVNATGGYMGAGIGGGGTYANNKASGGGSNITISGGEVTAVGGQYAAGIGGGGGYGSSITSGTGTDISITGGIVDAQGGKPNNYGDYAGDPIGNGGNASGDAGVTRTAGIIFEGGAGKVYGTVTLDQDYTLRVNYSLTISAGASLSGSGTLSGGGTFQTENVTEDMISVPEGWRYTGEDLSEQIKGAVSLSGDTIICGQTFHADTTGWELSVAKVSDLKYTVTYTHTDGQAVSKDVTIAQAQTTLTNIKTYMADGTSSARIFSAGDTFVVKATPVFPANNAIMTADFTEPTGAQMAVYYDDKQISEPSTVDENGAHTMTVDTNVFPLEALNKEITLTVKYIESDNASGADAEAKVKIFADAQVDIGGTTTFYGTIDAAWTAAKGGESIVTLLANVSVINSLSVSNSDNITFNGGTYSLGIETGFTINGGELTITGGTVTITSGNNGVSLNGGKLTVTGGTIEAKHSEGVGIKVFDGGDNGGTVQISGSAVIKGQKYGVECDSRTADIKISGGTITGSENAVILGQTWNRSVSELLENYGGTTGTHYAFYQNGIPVTSGLDSRTLPGGTYTVGVCTHPEALQDQGNGTHGGDCPYCGTEFAAASHTLNDSNFCTGCNTQMKVQVEIGNATTYYGDIDAAWEAATAEGVTSAEITLLADTKAQILGVDDGNQIALSGGSHTLSIHGINVDGGQLDITGGVFKFAGAGLRVSGGTVRLSGGEFISTSTGADKDPAISCIPPGSGLTVDGFLAEGCAYYQDGQPIAMTGQTELAGTVTVQECKHDANVCKYQPLDNGTSHKKTCLACGMTWDAEPHTLGADNRCAQCEAELVAQVNDACYSDIKAAWGAACAVDSATLTLLRDVETGDMLYVNSGNITFDGGNFTLKSTNPALAVNVDGGTLTVVSGTMISGRHTCVNITDGVLVVKGGKIETSDYEGINVAGGTAIISGGEVRGSSVGVTCGKNAELIISGGTFYCLSNGSTVNVIGGKVGEVLLNYGDANAETHYAFYRDDKPYKLPDGGTLPGGTFTVQQCKEPLAYTHASGTTKHTQSCQYCGAGNSETDCNFTWTDNTGTGVCNCGATLVVNVSEVELTYDGTAKEPGVTVKLDNQELTVNTNYTVAYTNNINAGTASVTVSGTNGTNWEYAQEFNIAKAALTIKANDQTITYGQSITQGTGQVTVTTLCGSDTLEGITLTASSDQVAVANKTIAPSGAVIKNSGKDVTGNYGISYETGSLTINKADQDAPAAPSATDANIKDSSITLTAIDGAEYRMGEDGNWQNSPIFNGLNPNQTYTFYARLKEDSNHNPSPASAAASITTKKTMLNDAVVTVSGTYTYDGTAQVPTADQVTVKLGDTIISSEQYTISGSSINAGEATVTITATADGNYSGSADGKFNIARATLTIKANDQTIAFGQSIDDTAVTSTGLCTGDRLDSITLVPSTANVPGGTIEPSDAVIKNASGEDVAGNYQITYETGKLTITPVEVKLTFTDQTITYGDTPKQAAADPASAVIAYSYTGTSSGNGWPTDVGTYTITAKVEANGNYGAASATAALTINPKTVSATVAAEPDSYVYTGEAITPTKVEVKDGNTVIPASEYTVEYSNNTNVGIATVTITDKDDGNYTVSGSTTFTITAKPLTGASVNVSGTFTYSGNAHTPDPTVTLGGRTLAKDTDYSVAYSDNVDAGTATITITGKGNYSGTASGTFTIGRATLTADGTGIASGTYGKKLSELEVTGLTAKMGDTVVNGSWALTGETIPDVGDSKTYTATFTPASGAGNYETLTAQVTLNISKVDYTGIKTANTSAKFGLTKTYDLKDLLPAGYELGTITVSDSNSIFDGTPSVSGTTLTYKLVDNESNVNKTGDIIIPVTSSTNYKAFNLTITVTVTNVQVPDLKVNPISVTYTGSPVPDSSISGTATVDGQPISGTWSFVEGQNITNVSDSGTKQVRFTPGNTDLYGPNTGTVTVTISKATPSLSLTASPATLPSGGTVTLTLSGLPAGGSATVTCSDANISVTKGSGNTWTADLPAGGASYTFTASYAGDGNHNSATANCTASVEKITPTLSLTAAPASLTGGGTVTLTLTGLPTGGTATVTCSNGITVTAGAGNTWTATLPNSTATYTFTASYAGNDSYHAASASCTVTTTEVVILPNPPAGDENTQFQLVMETTISEVPEGLKDIESLNTPEKLILAMKTAITEANSGVNQANTAVYDVELMVSTNGGSTWTPATKENFPSGGLVITLPYPEGTNSSYKFTVVHMFTSSDFGKRPGDTETPAVTNTADGIRFTVSGLSPISVGWEQPSTPSTPTGPSISNPTGGGGGGVSTYAITVEKSEHGKVTSNRVNASSNSTVTLTVTPDSGYVLDTLTVTDSRGNEIKLTAQGGGKYTFTMPSRAVTVKATFAPLPADVEQPCDGGAACPSHGFTDLGTVGTWYHEAVDYVLRNGLMNGYNSTMFGPNDNLSRAQLAQILYNKEGKPLVTSGSVFTDVADGQWYAPAITWAAANGIVGGYGNGRFGPDDNITREQLAVMLWRYAGSPAATDKELHFTDADQASGYALEALRWAVENGILNGYGDGRLNPGGLATRAQVAQMLKNFIEQQ